MMIFDLSERADRDQQGAFDSWDENAARYAEAIAPCVAYGVSRDRIATASRRIAGSHRTSRPMTPGREPTTGWATC
jgi:hypothetical protein